MKILFTGGGTAGHVTPNIALIENLRAAGWDIVYVGSADGIERQIMDRINVRYHAIATGKLRRYFDWRNFVDPLRIVIGFLQSLVICVRERPDVVFSKGGFVAVPVIFAAWVARIPAIGHESDVTPGLANKLCFPLLKKICVNFAVTRRYLPEGKVVVTGTPVRENLLGGRPDEGRRALGLDDGKPVLLVFGGSLGAVSINRQIRDVLDQLIAKFQVVHVVGEGNLDSSLEKIGGYRQQEFLFEEFGDVLAAADVIIARAGANSLYELLVTRKPHILIPLSSSVSRGDQLDNARTFTGQGFSRMLEESELDNEKFLKLIDSVYDERAAITSKLAEFEVIDSVAVITDLIKAVSKGT